jgi:transposase
LEDYRGILERGLKESGDPMPTPQPQPPPKQKGRVAKTKTRNLLESFINFEDAILRFASNKDVPTTNNAAERPFRMLKLHMKVSGCFKSEEYGKGYCRTLGYLMSCKNHGIGAYEAITMLLNNETPSFITEILEK